MQSRTIKNWSQVKQRLQERYTHLTSEDLLYNEGREYELYERLSKKIGKSTDDVQQMLGTGEF